jgi:hypothetical protein
MLIGAENQLGTTAQSIMQAGGQIAESLVQKTLAMQEEVRQFAGRLNGLRQEIETAAAHVLASGT